MGLNLIRKFQDFEEKKWQYAKQWKNHLFETYQIEPKSIYIYHHFTIFEERWKNERKIKYFITLGKWMLIFDKKILKKQDSLD